jgi:ERF superfamily
MHEVWYDREADNSRMYFLNKSPMIDYPYYTPTTAPDFTVPLTTVFNTPITIGSSMNRNLSNALLLAVREIENPTKNTKNPFLKNNYADIVAVLEACKKELLKQGIVLIQGSRPSSINPQWVEVYTKLIHGESGESMEETVVMQPKEASPQGFAGLLTYGRRYSLFAALGLAAVDDDDDGNVATQVTGAATLARPKPKA